MLQENEGADESIDDKLIASFSKILNQKIHNKEFSIIKRTKYIVIEKGSNSIIVDDDNLYMETQLLNQISDEITLHSVNSLTKALYKNCLLTKNDNNSRCYRFHVQNSQGNPYLLYTYGISKSIITAENRMLINLTDKMKFMLTFSELEQSKILPLGISFDKLFVGKDISYGNKLNNSIFITGQSGQGKTYLGTNLLPSLAMLGSRVIVFDISNSFSHNEVMRALPEDVIDYLFSFSKIDTGKDKLPVNPLYIGDCTSLPEKKRRIVGFMEAACGGLSKADKKYIKSVVSEILKTNDNISSVNSCLLSSSLTKSNTEFLNSVYTLIDDIDKIGFHEQTWGTFFDTAKKISVISLEDASAGNIHSLLDVLISSLFEWQKEQSSPLTIVIDEIREQNFNDDSPLHKILTQGRKFLTSFIGLTQHYITQGNHSVDVMKEAGIKIFFKPSKSQDRIADELGFKNSADAGFGSISIGDFFLSCDVYNKDDRINEPAVIQCKTVEFKETPFYEKLKIEMNTK